MPKTLVLDIRELAVSKAWNESLLESILQNFLMILAVNL